MTTQDYKNELEDRLLDLLEQRVPYNQTFDDVTVKTTGKYLIILWFGTEDDPKGKINFSERRIPFNRKHIEAEILRQETKLKNKR